MISCDCYCRIEYFLYQKEKGVMSQLLDLRIRIAKRDIQMRYYLLMLWIRNKLANWTTSKLITSITQRKKTIDL